MPCSITHLYGTLTIIIPLYLLCIHCVFIYFICIHNILFLNARQYKYLHDILGK
jgi:hypothetical protein